MPVAYLSFCERLEEWLAEKHDMCVTIHDHAGSLVIAQSPIELEPKLPKELHRALQIADRQVDEQTPGLHRNPGSHFRTLKVFIFMIVGAGCS
jgi:cell wall assembly regulator SMI1